ncbi:MAG TPA: molybdenum cofactor guanylyltransferase [Urbifossiella sp.]
MQTGGIVLCGGRSSRMGRPKAWLPFGGELLLPRIVRILHEEVEPIVVVAAPDQDVPPLPTEIEIVRDEVEGRGPLQGLAAGLAALHGQVDAVYLSSCDVPFLKPVFVRRIVEFLGAPTDGLSPRSKIAVPKVGDFYHPLAAAYHIDILPEVRSLLAADRLRPTFLFDAVPTRIIKADELADIDPAFDSLRNLNSPEEYAAALRDLASQFE